MLQIAYLVSYADMSSVPHRGRQGDFHHRLATNKVVDDQVVKPTSLIADYLTLRSQLMVMCAFFFFRVLTPDFMSMYAGAEPCILSFLYSGGLREGPEYRISECPGTCEGTLGRWLWLGESSENALLTRNNMQISSKHTCCLQVLPGVL